MKKKISVITLILFAIFSIGTFANAAVMTSQYIDNCAAQAARSGTKILLTFDIVGRDTMDVLGAKTIIFQEQAPNSTQWTEVATIKSDDHSNMLKYNSRKHSSSISYSGAKSGYSYRAKVYFYAEKGGYDTREYITASV